MGWKALVKLSKTEVIVLFQCSDDDAIELLCDTLDLPFLVILKASISWKNLVTSNEDSLKLYKVFMKGPI